MGVWKFNFFPLVVMSQLTREEAINIKTEGKRHGAVPEWGQESKCMKAG